MKMDGMSKNLVAENIEQLKQLFPEAVTEGKIDFDVLRTLMGEEVEKRQEYYKFTWNGKEEARAYARERSMGTLRPCEKESFGKDGTPGKFDSGNLYIEGDNLEVLKLLQGAYDKQVKMIYIDPPYNTGKDFVYPDNFRDSISNYKTLTGQTDSEGKTTRANPETSGRYHTDWLNMMYPRLILARNLLKEDGVIFISIDDSEQDNLKKLCNEVFGEENFLVQIIWKKRSTPPNDQIIGAAHEYILVYTKDIAQVALHLRERSPEQFSRYKNPDNHPKGPWTAGDLGANVKGGRYVKSLYFPIINPQTGEEFYPPQNGNWRFNQDTIKKLLDNNEIYFGDNNHGRPKLKRFLCDVKQGITYTTMWDFVPLNTQGSAEMTSIFGNLSVFDNPKPMGLIYELYKLGSEKDSIILDFFSGSATTAHAAMQLNLEDNGNRKFIMVQLPELTQADSEAFHSGYKNICEIGKERIRRAGKKLKEENPLYVGDIGFRVFKLDTSNLLPWNPHADTLREDLLAAVNNVLADRTTKDLLYEILLKCNIHEALTLPIDVKQVGDNTVYIIGAGALAICLDTSIPTTVAEAIVKFKQEYAPIVPMQVVFCDNGFNDVSKTNAMQILQQGGIDEQSIQTF